MAEAVNDTGLIAPHGGVLRELLVGGAEAEALRAEAGSLPVWDLTRRQFCDVELLLNGGLSPLGGFMGREAYESVVETLRLPDGTLWPVPVALDVSEAFASGVDPGARIALRDPEGLLLAVAEIDELWRPDRRWEAEHVYGTADPGHPGADHLLHRTHPVYLGGRLLGLSLPLHYDYLHLRDTPRELREKYRKWGWRRVVGFQTRNPMHRVHQELTFRAAQETEANLLLHPIAGMTRPGDVDHYARVRCYEHVLKRYPEQTTTLSLLPLAMRMAGPREALWQAIIGKNYGYTHFIVGRDHAGPGTDAQGRRFYDPDAAPALVRAHQEELGVEAVPFKEMGYVEERAEYLPLDEVPEGASVLTISSAELRRRLDEGLEVPEWFSYSEVVEELRRTHKPRHRQGFTVFFTGLSGAGKSTIANALRVKLLELGGRGVTLLDGDIVRKHLSSELGFSREHRDLNILRIGFVASEITKNGGVAICAPIAPYRETRRRVREMVGAAGGFIEVYVSTPLPVCEGRDRKGLYARARQGLIPGFTGVSDPYEAPERPEVEVDTSACSPDEAAQRLLLALERLGYVR